MKDLIYYKGNKYSQNGEDGVLEELFKRLNIKNGYFVDVGAWDGRYLSNTFKLLEEGWSGLEVEQDSNRFIDLIHNTAPFPDVSKALLHIEANDLEKVLSLYKVAREFDFLDIDIDSYDYWLWKNLQDYLPKVVLIEYSGLEMGDQIYPPKTSASSMVKLGKDKGYTLVCNCGNLVFLRNDYT